MKAVIETNQRGIKVERIEIYVLGDTLRFSVENLLMKLELNGLISGKESLRVAIDKSFENQFNFLNQFESFFIEDLK